MAEKIIDTATTQPLFISRELSDQILITHNSDQTHQVDLQHLVKLIESIFQNAAAASKGIDQNAMMSILQASDDMRQALDDIRSISCEMSCILSAGKVHETTMELLRKLGNYSWNAKVILAMAAFASRIGELSMLVKHRNTDPIAKTIDILKGHSSTLDFSVLENLGLFRAMMEVVNTNLAFLATISKISKESASIDSAVACFPAATYKILHIVLQIASILSKIVDYNEFIRLTKEVSDINIILQEKLELCKKEGEKTAPYQYQYQYHSQYEDVTKRISKLSISEVIDKIKMKIQDSENLRNRHVLYLISDLDISMEEIKVLNSLYQRNDEKYKIVWLPIVNVLTYDARRFSDLKQLMKWTVVEPFSLELDVIEYIKKEWHFIKKSIAVSVNSGGEVTCQNALPMLWTWGNLAFPFSEKTEQDLWNKIDEQNGWKIDLLLDKHIIPDISSWTETGTFVCLFGGGDISWIQEFTDKVKYAAYAAGVSLKLVYTGNNKSKRIARNEVSRDINFLESECQWQFWTRLESIMDAKIRLGKTVTAYKTDRVMQEALKVVGYGGTGEAWAIFSMGKDAMVTTNGKMALTIMSDYQNWKQETGIRFLEGLKNYKSVISRDVHGCINVHLPVLGQIPGIMICTECSKVMEMFYTYSCCPSN